MVFVACGLLVVVCVFLFVLLFLFFGFRLLFVNRCVLPFGCLCDVLCIVR